MILGSEFIESIIIKGGTMKKRFSKKNIINTILLFSLTIAMMGCEVFYCN